MSEDSQQPTATPSPSQSQSPSSPSPADPEQSAAKSRVWGTAMRRTIFEPPLAVQRYWWVHYWIKNRPQIKVVTDLGSGNGRISNWVKDVPSLKMVNFVDCDLPLLESEIDSYYMPTFLEMSFGRDNCDTPIRLRIYHGDIARPDERVQADMMMMIEVIEHMDEQVFQASERALFGTYQPRYVLVSTPNREFNQLLRKHGDSPTEFRHPDHKFEWTRAEFQEWAAGVCRRYPYRASFDGVGKLPHTIDVGFCTQVVVFTRLDECARIEASGSVATSVELDGGGAVQLDDYARYKPPNRPALTDRPMKMLAEYEIPPCKRTEPPPAYTHYDWSQASPCSSPRGEANSSSLEERSDECTDESSRNTPEGQPLYSKSRRSSSK